MRCSSKQVDSYENRSSAFNERELFRELVTHLRLERASLREEWARRIQEAELLTTMTREEIFTEATAIYDNYIKVLETGSVKDLQAYARDLSRRIIHQGVETHEVLGIVLLLRDVVARSLFQKYHGDLELLGRVFDAYEPAANRIANTVAVSFIEQRERVIRRQQKALQILHVQEKERKRISRELHDEVGQALAAINTHLALVQRQRIGEQDFVFRTAIADVEKLLIGAIERMHSFARALRSAALDDLGLLPALRSYLKDYAERTGLLVRFERAAKDVRLNAEQETALFRIAQESLALQHRELCFINILGNQDARAPSGLSALSVHDLRSTCECQDHRKGTSKSRLYVHKFGISLKEMPANSRWRTIRGKLNRGKKSRSSARIHNEPHAAPDGRDPR